jgi:hypothetical protein
MLSPMHLPEHLAHHIETMARLHADNRYDRMTHDVETITGQPPESVREFVFEHADLFTRPAEAAARV